MTRHLLLATGRGVRLALWALAALTAVAASEPATIPLDAPPPCTTDAECAGHPSGVCWEDMPCWEVVGQ